MRVWERGSGETMACGTGACAVMYACYLNKYTGKKVTGYTGYAIESNVTMKKGTLDITASSGDSQYAVDKYGAFKNVPNIDPMYSCKIKYNLDTTSADNAVEGDLTDLYNTYNAHYFKIYPNGETVENSNNNFSVKDYDFTNELEKDRVGIGFTWTASTRTLVITGIKNEEANLLLPSDLIIDIQGENQNYIRFIGVKGSNLTIKGNETASLTLKGKVLIYNCEGNNKEKFKNIFNLNYNSSRDWCYCLSLFWRWKW